MGNQEVDQSYVTMGRFSYGEIKRIGKGGKIRVGNFTSIASEVEAIMVGHNVRWVSTFPFTARKIRGNFERARPKQLPQPINWYQDVLIGSDVWIGHRVTIMGGVIIHDGAIVGAGSVVTHDVPPYSIHVGNPAKHYRFRYAESQIELLLKIKWWEWDIEKIEDNLDVLCSDQIDTFLGRHI